MGRNALPGLLLVGAILLAAAHVETRAEDNATTTLDWVCGMLGGEYVTADLCFSALCSDASDPCLRAAARGGAPAVAALAARLAARNATAAQASIRAVAAASLSGTNATLSASAPPLLTCVKLYEGVVPSLRWAAASVAAGRYRGARELMRAAEYAAGGCGGVMEGVAGLPPENSMFWYMARVAHAVLAYVARD